MPQQEGRLQESERLRIAADEQAKTELLQLEAETKRELDRHAADRKAEALQIADMMKEMAIVRAELVQYKAGEEERWAQRKKEFLQSDEFGDILAIKTADMIKIECDGAIKQVKAGVPIDRIDMHKIVDEIPNEAL